MRPGSYDPLNELKNSHSTSLIEHKLEFPDLYRARSAKVLLSRGSSFPALPHDLSADAVEETSKRRNYHKNLIENDPKVFRKKASHDSSSRYINEVHCVKDLLNETHPLRDRNDIDKKRREKLNFSIKSELDLKEKKDFEEFKFNTLRPIEDFVRPEDTSSLRQTGYEHGHVRSLLKLDVFGPAGAMKAKIERDEGKIPPSPNVDRYTKTESANKFSSLSPVSRCSTASSASSYSYKNQRKFFPEPKDSLDDFKQLFHQSADLNNTRGSTGNNINNNNNNNGVTFTASTTSLTGLLNFTRNNTALTNTTTDQKRVMSGSLGYHGQHINTEDRLKRDPFVRRKAWHKSYIIRELEKKELKQVEKENKQFRLSQEYLAHKERGAIREFEQNLTLAKLSVV